jgi:predicted acylesterase/phospholipase RssA
MGSDITLVLSGSGALYPVHLGAAQALWEAGYRWSRVVGTSGGAIVAAFLASGKPPHAGLGLMKTVLPRDCLRFNWRFWKKGYWGLYSLKRLEAKLAPYVPDIFARAELELYIVTTDLVARRPFVWSAEHTPTASVPQAARMSASVTGLIAPQPMIWQNGYHLFTDGGVTNNFAVDYLDGPAVGIRLLSNGEDGPRPIFSFRDMLTATLGSMMAAIEREHIEDATFAKVVSIPVKWNSMDFWTVTAARVDEFYETGYLYMKQKINEGRLV